MSDAVKLSVSARARRSRGRKGAFVAWAIAVSVHGVALVVLHFVGPSIFEAPPPMQSVATGGGSDDRPMEISSIMDDLDRPDRPSVAEKERDEIARKEAEDPHPKGQIVDIAKPTMEEHPQDAKYLAEYDSKVDHETKGPRGRDKAGSVAVPPTPAVQGAQASKTSAGGQGGLQGGPGEKLAMVPPTTPSHSMGGHEGHPVADDGEMQRETGQGHGGEAAQNPLLARPTQTGAGGENGDGKTAGRPSPSSRPLPNLQPTPEMLQHAIGAGPGSPDYLKNIDDGDSTALNAKKFKYASFFNRIKRAVQQEWNPSVVYQQHDPSGHVYGVKDRVTVLRVHLTPDGKVASCDVMNSSGAAFLDDEAVTSFKKAAPFANVPKDLVEADGQVSFTFAFILELSGRTSTKVYKY